MRRIAVVATSTTLPAELFQEFVQRAAVATCKLVSASRTIQVVLDDEVYCYHKEAGKGSYEEHRYGCLSNDDAANEQLAAIRRLSGYATPNVRRIYFESPISAVMQTVVSGGDIEAVARDATESLQSYHCAVVVWDAAQKSRENRVYADSRLFLDPNKVPTPGMEAAVANIVPRPTKLVLWQLAAKWINLPTSGPWWSQEDEATAIRLLAL